MGCGGQVGPSQGYLPVAIPQSNSPLAALGRRVSRGRHRNGRAKLRAHKFADCALRLRESRAVEGHNLDVYIAEERALARASERYMSGWEQGT